MNHHPKRSGGGVETRPTEEDEPPLMGIREASRHHTQRGRETATDRAGGGRDAAPPNRREDKCSTAQKKRGRGRQPHPKEGKKGSTTQRKEGESKSEGCLLSACGAGVPETFMDDLWNYVCTGCLFSRLEQGAALNIITKHTEPHH